MSLLRLTLAGAAAILLVGGYLTYVWCAVQGDAIQYAQVADSAPVRALALLILVSGIVLAFVKDKQQPKK